VAYTEGEQEIWSHALTLGSQTDSTRKGFNILHRPLPLQVFTLTYHVTKYPRWSPSIFATTSDKNWGEKGLGIRLLLQCACIIHRGFPLLEGWR